MESPTIATRWPFLRIDAGFGATSARAPVNADRIRSAARPVSLRIGLLLLLSEYLTHVVQTAELLVDALLRPDRRLEQVERRAQAQRPGPALGPVDDHPRPHGPVGQAVDDDEGAGRAVLLVGVEGGRLLEIDGDLRD